MNKPAIGITIVGKDYGGLGLTDEEVDAALDARIEVIEAHGLVGGGILLDALDLEVDFIATREDNKPVTVKAWLAFCAAYRAAFPTFDGHVYITDANHVTSDLAKSIDSFLN